MEAIKEWLNSDNKDYVTGLSLLAKNMKNRILIQNLNRRKHPKKLQYELQKLYDRLSKNKKLEAKNKQKAKETNFIVLTKDSKVEDVNLKKNLKLKIVVNKREVDFKDLPDTFQKLYEETVENYKIMRTFHEKLKLMSKAPDKQREALVSQILLLDEKIRKNWAEIDAWDGSNDSTKKNTEPTAPKDAAVDAKRIGTNRKFISANKAKLAGLIKDKDPKAEELREKVQQRINELKEADVDFEQETVNELKDLGIKFE